MSKSYDWENNKKIYKKISLHDFLGKGVVLQKVANRVVANFWILCKTLSLDYRPKGKRIIWKSKNL